MLVVEDKPLITDSTFRMGSLIIEGCAAAFCPSIRGLRITLLATTKAIPATRTTINEAGFVLYGLCIFVDSTM